MQDKVTNIAPFLNSVSSSSSSSSMSPEPQSVPSTIERKLIYFLGKLNISKLGELANLAGASLDDTSQAMTRIYSLDLVTQTDDGNGNISYQLTQNGSLVASNISL